MATARRRALRRRFRQQGRADRDRRRRRAREADRPRRSSSRRWRTRSSAPPAPATAPRTTSAPSSTRPPATCACGASSRWSRRSRIISSRSASRTRRSCSRAPCSATSSSIRCRRSSSAASPPRPPSRSSSRRSATPSASASIEEFKDRVSEIITGVVKRVEFGHVVVDLGRAEGVIRRDQQIPREVVRVGDRIRSLILSVRRENRGPQIFLSPRPSRLHEEAVRAGSARDLRRHHRDQGRRPRSGQPRQDRRDQPRQLDRPGRRLRRHEGQPRPGGRPGAAGREDRHHPLVPRTLATFVVNALQPATVSRVVIDEEESRIEVVVPDDQLSLAIGRRGQNVRLASQLTGSAIDILTEADASEKRQREFVERSEMFQNELDVDETLAQLLVAEGFGALEEVAYVELDELASIEGFDDELAAELQSRAPGSAGAPRGGRARGAPRARRLRRAGRDALSHRGDAGDARQGRASRRSTISPISPPTSWSRRSGPSSAASASQQPARGQGRRARRIWPQRRAGQRDHHGRPRPLVRGRSSRKREDAVAETSQ